ncbi:MAG: UvrD-helicase domain-containing protein, partial [Lachnospiraceae bacterium]|nr:UvrD-helicase domain-containing protein [Lachnospiraceae bacterium]
HEFMENDATQFERLCKCCTYTEYYEALNGIVYENFPRKRFEGAYLDIKDEVLALRNKVKKNIGGVISSFFGKPVNATIGELYEYHDTMNELIDITQEFRKRFSEKKRDEVVIDFNDIEHMALEILLERDGDGNVNRSGAALEMMELYEYIMVDEYQDSNEVQETILNAIARQGSGVNNMFMVGDVKQSIYQFRLAKPDIFEKKRRTYTDEDSECQRIIFGRNFRSRTNILSAVNYIFSNIMHERIGGVTYDREHMFVMDENENTDTDRMRDNMPVEVIYVTEDSKSDIDVGKGGESDGELSDYGKRELEAAVIASRIREIVDDESGMMIYDKESGCDRRVGYGDIVILLRSMSGWAEEFVETLTLNGVPAYADEKSGYFSAYEIQIILSMLKIIDNPKQDIPLVSVLKSVYAGFNEEELAGIRLCGGGCMY